MSAGLAGFVDLPDLALSLACYVEELLRKLDGLELRVHDDL